jgi:hypothetical protein
MALIVIESKKDKGNTQLINLCPLDKIHANICYAVVPESPISSRGDGLDQNLLYPPLEEEGPPLFSQLLWK